MLIKQKNRTSAVFWDTSSISAQPIQNRKWCYLRGYYWYFAARHYHIEAETQRTPFPRRHFRMHFLEGKCLNFDRISLKFVSKGPINYISALVQIMAWRRPGAKPSETMMFRLLTHICVTRLQWVKVIMHNIAFICVMARFKKGCVNVDVFLSDDICLLGR